ncbi:MOSC domain-containing protein [Klenkia sp. LSe6-5]|uniref:MOSC domain-containing protein n=1 Tax=Klenkia sesuvii TaxID=3103137 RepID=A0ABU8DXR7_9ACTN
MTGRVEAVCVSGSDLLPLPGKRPSTTGIRKRPVGGRVAVLDETLDGDRQVNRKHHGGEGQAVYAYAAEDAAWWATDLGRDLPAGSFGENLRTTGLDLTGAVLGSRWAVGSALLEVTAPRIPCANFARFWDVPDLVKRFTAHGASGAYLRVLQTGDVGAGDAVEVVHVPDHGVTTGLLFRALTTQRSRLVEVEPALDVVPHKDRDKLTRRIAALVG